MRVGLLGPLEIVGDDGLDVAISARKPKELLAVLALHVGDVVPADVLVEELWGDDPPADARNALQVLVRRLRTALAPAEVIATQAPGYRLDLTRDDVDVSHFERLAQEEAWHEALALWRGEPLADFVYEPFAQHPRAVLIERWLTALEGRIEADLGSGEVDALVPELEELVMQHPLRERLHAQLMRALYRAGRQADALRAFQSARTTLADELGLEPGPELRDLERAVLDQDPSLRPEPTSRPRHTAPRPLSSFVGREPEIEQVLTYLEQHRVVTLVGPGGAGKTRLALECVHRAEVDAWLIELAPVDGTAVVSTAAAALGVDDASRIEAFLARRQAIIVLDNCEHVLDEAARLAERLARAGDDVTVLATSRERLAIPGEHTWLVPPLSDVDAAALFDERSAEDVIDDGDLVKRICARLDGLPLAVELAAARTRALALDDIVERLDDRFRLLTTGSRTAEPRQQTLRSVVDWSHELLFAGEQALFRRLSVFAGRFGLDDAEQVCTGDDVPAEDVVDLLGHLVDKSLVVAATQDHESRYHLLETLREYGRQQLDRAGESDATRARHLEWLVGLTHEAEHELRGPDQQRWASRMSECRHDVRAAIEWALAHERPCDALAAAKAMAYAWYLDGNVAEGHALLSEALAACDDPAPDDRCTALAWIGWFGQHGASPMAESVAHIDAAIEAGRVARARPFVVACVFGAILGLDRVGPTGLPLLDDAAERLERERDTWATAMLLWAKGTLARNLGDADGAAKLLRSSYEHYEAVGDRWGTVLPAARLGELALDQGRYDEAFDMMTKAFEAIATTRTSAFQAASIAASLGLVATMQGRDVEADAWHARAIAMATDGGYPRAVAQAHNSMGVAARQRGDLEEAERLHREALATLAPIGPVVGEALALTSLGTLADLAGHLDEATSLHFDAFVAASRSNDSRPMAASIEGLAAVEGARGNGLAAATLLGTASSVRSRIAAAVYPLEQVDIDRAANRAAALVGDDAAAAARAAGAERSADVLALLDQRKLPEG